MGNNYEEKRKSNRIPSEITAKINNEKCHINNISAGGAFILSTYPGTIGQEVLVIFPLNNNVFEKIAIIREIVTASRLTVPVYVSGKRRSALYRIHIEFTEPLHDSEVY
ncbi:MAG: PilZ domain-containing protein [Leptospiraceae bacterium]|nr:PilZ domain-containing protein [Leptospiraceae bacterium]